MSYGNWHDIIINMTKSPGESYWVEFIYLFIYLFGARKADRCTGVFERMQLKFKCLRKNTRFTIIKINVIYSSLL